MSVAIKEARIEFKASVELKHLLSEAAKLSGLDLSAFLISIAEPRARAVIQDYQSLSLSKSAQQKLFNVLMNPPKPSSELKSLMQQDSFLEH